MNTPKKLQSILIRQLLEKGTVQLILPDGVQLEIGITQEDQFGKPQKSEDYCYVTAKRQGKTIMLDSYNLGLQFEEEDNTIVLENEVLGESGQILHSLDVF